jgi:sugar phosphate permease
VQGRVFYGWWILAASVVIELFGLGFGIFAITTVYPYVIETFPDWPRHVVFLPTSIVIAIAGSLAWVTGVVIDRYPIRRVFVAGIVVQSAALYAFGRVETQTQYLATAVALGLGLAGVTILPNQVLVSRWFRSRVGLVNGIILGATALGAAIAPPLITRLVEALGDWRAAFTWIAALAFGPPLVVVLLVVRDRPEDVGLRPYGEAATDAPSDLRGLTLAESARRWSFWALALVVVLGGMPCYSFNKHVLVQLQELGYGKVRAADLKSLYFAVSGCARVSFGYLADRFDERMVVLAHTACIAAAYPLLLTVPAHPALLYPCLVVLGIGYGGLLPAIPVMAVHLFGRAHLGSILGAYKIPYDAAAAGAPLLTAALYDRFGGYAVPERLNAALAVAGFLVACLWLTRLPAPSTGRPAPE